MGQIEVTSSNEVIRIQFVSESIAQKERRKDKQVTVSIRAHIRKWLCYYSKNNRQIPNGVTLSKRFSSHPHFWTKGMAKVRQ